MKDDNYPPLGDTWRFKSHYGQTFTILEFVNGEMEKLIAQRRQELKDEGYDVDNYDKEYHRLEQECLEKIKVTKDIYQREKISLEYNKKRNELANKYLNIDLNWVTDV